MICPFKASATHGDVCPDCGLGFALDMDCGLTAYTKLPGEPITAGKAEVCDPASGVCESCQ